MNKEKIINKQFVIIDFILIFCILFFLAITHFITKQNEVSKIFYFDGTKAWQTPSLYIVANICLLIFPITLFLQLKKNVRNIILCIVVGVITIFLTIYIWIVFSDWNREEKYYYFTSPITEKEIIAEEWSWLLGGGVNFYETINKKQIHLIGDISTDNGYRPLENNAYSMKWSANEVTINFSFRGSGQNEIWKTETLKFNTKK